MFKKMDEMELNHTMHAVKLVYLYSVLFEFVCWIVECINAKDIIFTTMFFLLCTQNIVLYLARLYYKIKVEDPQGKKGVVVMILTAVVALLFGYICAQI